MAYSRVSLPVNGYTDSLPYRGSVQGYTSNCLNVFPYDSFDNRRRIGTRPGFLLVGDTTAKIQGSITVENFVSGSLKRRFLYVSGGKIFVTDNTADPVQCQIVAQTANNAFSAAYDNTSTDVTKRPRGENANVSITQEAMPLTDETTDLSVVTRRIFAPADNVEMVAFKHVGHRDEDSFGAAQASTTITVGSNPSNDQTITLVDYAGASVVITAKTSGASGAQFNIDAGDTATTAANLKAAIEANTTILCAISGNVITLHQRQGGSDGNKAVASTLSGVSVGGNTFSGGTDDEPHDYVYMTDGKRYVKVDMSTATPIVSQWIAPYKTVSSTSGESTKFARLTAQFNSRIALAGIDTAPTNWFLSAINNPFDWQPADGTSLSVGAVAGSTGTKFGETGDNIKALIPVGSSGLLLACSNSMVIITNDPVFSDATVRRISGAIGCLGPRAFTNVGEMGVLIASPQGVFGVDPNSFDIEKGSRISKDKLDRLFANTDFEDTEVVMGYDDARAIAFLAITRTDDASASRIYALDMGTGSWWPWRIEASEMRSVNNIVPFQPADGTRPTPWMTTNTGHILTLPQEIILSKDGNVLTSTSFTSAGFVATANATDIKSNVQIGPINGDPSRRVMLKEVRVILGQQNERDASGNVLVPDTTNGPFLEVIQGESAQEAVGTVAGFTATEENVPVLDCNASGTTFESVGPINGGDSSANPTSGNEKILWGGFASPVTGTYTPSTGDTIVNDTTFSGPGQWTFSRSSAGKWQFKHGTDFYLTTSSNLDWFETTNAVDGLPEEVDINTLMFGRQTDHQVRLSESNFEDRAISEKRPLARGRDSANRFRIRASDIFLSITADGRSFAIEDISVDVEDGGPFRSSS